jgi:hypothetical protein
MIAGEKAVEAASGPGSPDVSNDADVSRRRVTFGGAYAVLAYVTQAAAGSFGWLMRAQAVDGLALAETTQVNRA